MSRDFCGTPAPGSAALKRARSASHSACSRLSGGSDDTAAGVPAASSAGHPQCTSWRILMEKFAV